MPQKNWAQPRMKSVVLGGARPPHIKRQSRDCSLTQMDDSYRCRANSPESMTTKMIATAIFTPKFENLSGEIKR
jgi:hypothetical protein